MSSRDENRGTGVSVAAKPAGAHPPAGDVAVKDDTAFRRIDTHHHVLPPEYIATVGDQVIGAPAPNGRPPRWEVADSLQAMDRNGIDTAVVSLSSPSIWFGNSSDAKRLARSCNHFAAQMVADHPRRFGFFATVPLPDVTAALEEARFALDVLHGDGIVLMTNYDDRYLGDPAFARFFDEINERKAIVYVHPHVCGCSAGLMPDWPASGIEFPHDTTRTVGSLLFGGVFSRCPDIRFIFSHAGGTVPFLAHRIALVGAVHERLSGRVPQGQALPILRKQYYDTALSANPIALGALLQFVPPTQILLGTDFPFAPEPVMRDTLAGLRDQGLNKESLMAIEGGNAAGLFARLAVTA